MCPPLASLAHRGEWFTPSAPIDTFTEILHLLCSLEINLLCGINEFGGGTYTAEGIAKIADALKENKSLRSIRCASHAAKHCQRPLAPPYDDTTLLLTRPYF